MPRFILRQRFPVLAACVLMAGGCARSGDTLYPVVGTVQLEGRPLTFGGVSFRPAADKGNTSAHQPTGRIDENGVYELSTGTRRGAPPGWYRVLVFATPDTAPGMAPPKFVTHLKYTREETTDILLEVVPNPTETAYDLQVTKSK